jgi:hypothetical protein
MTIHLSCGHQVKSMTDAFDVSLADYDELGEACVIYARVCEDCRDLAHQEGRLLYDQGEENKWVGRKTA